MFLYRIILNSFAAVDICSNDTCSDGKVCLSSIGFTGCVCPTGFYGENCTFGEYLNDLSLLDTASDSEVTGFFYSFL